MPTWFLTLSEADLHWAEMIQAIALQLGKKILQTEVLQISMEQRSNYL